MKKFRLLMLLLLVAAASPVKAREWKTAKILDTSETDVSGKMWRDKNTLHYTIETDDMIYFVDYSYKPGGRSSTRVPNIAVTELTKVAIEGRHAYILDVTGREVKLHIVRKTAKK
jgi:hypothetical protein